jgi:hypothetical protein
MMELIHMALPPPPAAAAATAPAAAPAATPAAAPAVATETKAAAGVVGFGIGRGEGEIPVPTICDYAGLIDAMHKLVVDAGVDIEGVLKVYDATQKNKFPGNKNGRACYNFGNILKNLSKTHDMLHHVRRASTGEKKPRVKQSALFAEKLKLLAKTVGVDDTKLEEVLGKDFMAKLLGKAAETK